MDRRTLMAGMLGTAAAASLWTAPSAFALGLPKDKIKRIRYYKTPTDAAGRPNIHQPTFNQSTNVVTIETEGGLIGIGEGGEPSTMEQCAGLLIGQDPFRAEHLWQRMFRGYFYPAGREKTHSLGGLDLALWDLKGKMLSLPVHEILGGAVRNFCECYNTAGIIPGVRQGMSIKERAQLTIAEGYRAFRMGAAEAPANGTYNTHERLNQLYEDCVQAREGVGKSGDWAVDFHQRFDLSDAIRGCNLIQDLTPYFVEDPVRAEAFLEDIPILRRKVNVPLAAGEEWGNRWDFNKLVENHDLDYVRATLPNVGGITEMMKIAAICETHFVGIVPHFTGPVATAALVNCLSTYSGPVLMEYNYQGRTLPHLPVCLDFKEGKLYPNERPGLGVELNMKALTQVTEITQPVTARAQTYFRPDGSITNW